VFRGLAGSATGTGIATGVLIRIFNVTGQALGRLTASGILVSGNPPMELTQILEPPGLGAIDDPDFMLELAGHGGGSPTRLLED
jgi:hypothetical protein